LPRQKIVADHAKARVRYAGVRSLAVHPVEDVEELSLELQLRALGKEDRLGERHIPAQVARPVPVALRYIVVTEDESDGLRQATRVDPLGNGVRISEAWTPRVPRARSYSQLPGLVSRSSRRSSPLRASMLQVALRRCFRLR